MRYINIRPPEIVDLTVKKGDIMDKMVIKEVTEFTVVDENNNKIRKSKLVISNNGVDTEIILEGNGKVRVTTAV